MSSLILNSKVKEREKKQNKNQCASGQIKKQTHSKKKTTPIVEKGKNCEQYVKQENARSANRMKRQSRD
jgi:hypothetical protein